MPVGDSPTVARRRVRRALRDAREAQELTQAQVAEAMEWSLSKVIRIELGEVSIAPNDLRPLLGFLGINDRHRVATLLADAKTSRTRQRAWWLEPGYRENLTPALKQLIEFEAEAAAIRQFAIYSVPGPLQLPEYANALTHKFAEELTSDQIRYRVDARERRRETILSRAGALRLFVLLDESVLLRHIGGPQIFAAQLRELIRLAEEGIAAIRMVPFDVGVSVANNGGYDLLYLSEEDTDTDAVLYRETGLHDEIVEDPATTARHRARFDKLWSAALSEADTIAVTRDRLRTTTRDTTTGNDAPGR